jgi:PAS domain S-box-containing protein
VKGPFDGLTALIVEDDWLVREDIAGEFRREGWTVLEAGTGASALRRLRETKILDVLITDIRLADATTGWDIAEAARELHPKIPVIYASGNPNNDGRGVPESIFLNKPVTARELMLTLQQASGHRAIATARGIDMDLRRTRSKLTRNSIGADRLSIRDARIYPGGFQIIAEAFGPVGFPERLTGDRAAEHYAAIIESSDDAILSKDLNGVIMTWNRGAELLFGYTAEEAVGRPVTILIPMDRQDEEPFILERVRRGEKVDHYETIRQRKDGSLVDISLTVSPIKNERGEIVAASKIARDITETKRAQERQELLLREMDHRVKNLFTLAISVLTLSGRYASSIPQLIDSTRDRLSALARAHALTLSHGPRAPHAARPATLHSLLEAISAPHLGEGDGRRFSIIGCDMEISGSTISSLALLLHEFATNSVKYGALSSTAGQIEVHCADRAGNVVITWSERGGPRVAPPIGNEGFGDLLVRATVAGQLGGDISREWKPEGLLIRLSVPRERLTG